MVKRSAILSKRLAVAGTSIFKIGMEGAERRLRRVVDEVIKNSHFMQLSEKRDEP